MNMRTEPHYLEWPQVVPVSPEENADLRRNCTAIMAQGGETGEIAADILRINDEVTSLIEKLDAFLKR